MVATKLVKRPFRELTTVDLKAGMTLMSVLPQRSLAARRTNMSAFGVAHGIVYGDGYRSRRGSRVPLYGPKDTQLLKWFPLSKTYRHSTPDAVVVSDLPGYFKDLPPLDEAPSYLYGWLAGYFAADGDVSTCGASLNSVNRAALEHVRDICTILGVGTYGISEYWRIGLGQTEPHPIYRLRFVHATMKPDLFLIAAHRARYEGNKPAYDRMRWVVRGVTETDRTEEVFCATVPGTGTFALEDNILTGNCHGCDSAGAIYDLASVLNWGPTGRGLRGSAFREAERVVKAAYPDLGR